MHAEQRAPAKLARFNEIAATDAANEMLTYCHCERWAHALVADRPYPDIAALTSRSSELIESLAWPDVEEAMAAHPRIGDRVSGTDRAARLSRTEQAGVDEQARDALLDGNQRYEDRFGHVFLIRASGRSAAEMLAELERRLANDVPTERTEVRTQLAQITAARLEGAFT